MKIKCRLCFGRGERLRKNHFELDQCLKCNGTGKVDQVIDNTEVVRINKNIIRRRRIEERQEQARSAEAL